MARADGGRPEADIVKGHPSHAVLGQ
jgi:hypothetical protein